MTALRDRATALGMSACGTKMPIWNVRALVAMGWKADIIGSL